MFNSITKHLAVFILATLLTVVLTWPFTQNLATYYTDSGDYTGFGSILWWSFESLTNGRIFDSQKYFNGYQLYPMPYTIAFGDHLFVPSLIFGFFYILSQNFILSVNLLTFVSLILGFISCFYVINFFVKNFFASIIGAAVFTFNPITFAQFPQHAYLFNRVFLPPIFLFAYKFFKSPGFINAFFLGLFFTLNALTVIYYQIYTIFLLMVLALIHISVNLFKKNFYYIFQFIKGGLIILVFLPVLLYFDLPYLKFNSLEGAKRSLEQNIYYSARVADWFSPSRSSLLYKDLSYALNDKRLGLENQDNYYHEEHSLFLNLTPVFLFLVSLGYFLGKCKLKPGNSRHGLLSFLKRFFSLYLTSPLPLFLTVLAISFIMTFGPYFTGWNGNTGGFALPFYFFYEYLPFGKGVRVPTRFQFIFYLPFALLCAYGALFLFKKTKRYFFAVFMIILGLLVVENINVFSFDERSYILPKVERLSQNGELSFLRDKNVLHLPVIFPDFVLTEGVYHNWRVITGEKIVNMHSGYNPQDQVNLLLKLKEGVGEEALKRLVALGVNFIVIHQDLIDPEQYKQRFKINESLYQEITVFNNGDTRILDLSHYSLDIRKCSLDQDFDINIKSAEIFGSATSTTVLILKNKSNCYLPSIYQDRYQRMDFYTNFLKRTAYFRLPVIIDPFEEVVLSELNNELRIQ